MEWNPETHDYCHGCPNYESVGNYIYQLQSSAAKRKCKHLSRCGRVAKFVKKMELGAQMSIFDLGKGKG